MFKLDGRIQTQQGTVRAPGLEARGAMQRGRVAHGVKNGSISESELSQLKESRQEIRADLAAHKGDDGRVDLQERMAVHKDLNQLSGTIRDFKSDGKGPLGEKESFEASIVGDPHFSVDGEINGEEVSANFDNQDIGTRTQYAGAGFKLETDTVAWGDNGAAVVGSATTTTGFGPNADAVTINADGSVLVNGEAVSLESGEVMDLNKTSSLSLNDDGTYTVSSRNGKVTNTFDVKEHDNGNYLNIYSSVDDVQTVGWLQNQV